METIDVNELSGIWVCKTHDGSNVEISLNENNYAIAIDGVANNNGIFSLQKANQNNFIIFEMREKFDTTIDWKRLFIRYSIGGGNLILEGSVYKGTYTKKTT
jgi:hypothetical protein